MDEEENFPYYVDDKDSKEIIEINEQDAINELDAIDIEEDNKEHEDESNNDIIEPERDDAILVFQKHKDEVFVVRAGNGGEAVSGGKDDTAFVFDIDTGNILFECTGHKESVESVCFSHNNAFVATGDLDGCIKVWSLSEKKEIWSSDIAEIQWMMWHPKAPLLLAGDVEGNAFLWNIPFSHFKTLPSNGHACLCGSFLPDGKRAVCGYEDGSLKIWDLKTTTAIYQFNQHQSSVLCLDCHKGNVVLASGGSDGTVVLINSVSGQVIKKFSVSSSNEGDELNGVETLSFSPSLPDLAIGTAFGDFIIWNIDKTSSRFSNNCHQGNIINIIWHPKIDYVAFTCSVDGSVLGWDVRNGNRLGSFVGHRSAILGASITPNGSKILTASSDKTVRIFSTQT